MQITEHTTEFRNITGAVLEDMFGVGTSEVGPAEEQNSVTTQRTFIVSLHYTGTVFGEYLLAMDEETAARIIGIEDPITDENRDEIRDDICDAMSETLNTIVGQAIVGLQKEYSKLTMTAPRVYFGNIRYPQFRTGSTWVETEFGRVECCFCLDLMRLSLAESYDEAMKSILEINEKLKEANRHLAEQQAQLVQSEKLASVGMLAAGVAHEINTPLAFVSSNLSALNEYIEVMETSIGMYQKLINSIGGAVTIPEDDNDEDIDFVLDDTKELLSETKNGADRIERIVQSLKDFSHVDGGGNAQADFNVLIQNALTMMKQDIADTCTMELNLEDLPEITCNPGEIGQVLVNLIQNALHAFDKDENRLKISTVAADAGVTAIIEDNGCGIDYVTLSRVFDPFFTTKEIGKGTGLGLSISHGIVQRHGGSISIDSKPGSGTKVALRLPLAQSPVAV